MNAMPIQRLRCFLQDLLEQCLSDSVLFQIKGRPKKWINTMIYRNNVYVPFLVKRAPAATTLTNARLHKGLVKGPTATMFLHFLRLTS